MSLVIEGKVGKKGALYLPKRLAESLRLTEGTRVKYTVEGGRLIVEPIIDPFELAISGTKFAKTSQEEFEKESEGMQDALFGK